VITKNTVLVLGAGASVEYGFPTGEKLLRLLTRESRDETENKLFESLGLLEKANEFRKGLLYSATPSIDNYLSRKEGDDLRVGKLALAYELAACEVHDPLMKLDIEDNWYRYFWHRMLAEWKTPESLVGANKISVITFNYDRSLEHFLTTAIANTFTRPLPNATKIRRRLMRAIFHVYGSLGLYVPDEIAEARAYEPIKSIEKLEQAAAQIRIIPEAREESVVFEGARKILAEADQIGFLGFGFDATNVRRLSLAKALQGRAVTGQSMPRIVCTAFGRTETEVADIKNRLTEGIAPVEFFNTKIERALRDSGLLLS
jgi:hypothetical protein